MEKQAVDCARKAFLSGRSQPLQFRLQQLHGLYRLITEKESEIANALKQDIHRVSFILDLVNQNKSIWKVNHVQFRRIPFINLFVAGPWRISCLTLNVCQISLLPILCLVSFLNFDSSIWRLQLLMSCLTRAIINLKKTWVFFLHKEPVWHSSVRTNWAGKWHQVGREQSGRLGRSTSRQEEPSHTVGPGVHASGATGRGAHHWSLELPMGPHPSAPHWSHSCRYHSPNPFSLPKISKAFQSPQF